LSAMAWLAACFSSICGMMNVPRLENSPHAKARRE